MLRVPLYALSAVLFLMAAHRLTAGSTWSQIAGLGESLGSHLQGVFPAPDRWIRARRIRGAAARFISALLGMFVPPCIGAGMAELMLYRTVGIDPVFIV